ncbi:MAG: hypothetical protein P8Y58_03270 [Novosphingobium sp.]
MHFAVVTIAVTAAIALLADGSNRASDAKAAEQTATGQPDAVDLAIQGKDINKIKRRSATGMTGSLQFDDSAEVHIENTLDTGFDDFAIDTGDSLGSMRSFATLPEVRGLMANMTPEKWNEILEKRRKGEMDEEVRREDIDRLVAESRERSGSTAPADEEAGAY